jgi:hypothetical protein
MSRIVALLYPVALGALRLIPRTMIVRRAGIRKQTMSVPGTSRHFAAMQRLVGYQGRADSRKPSARAHALK